MDKAKLNKAITVAKGKLLYRLILTTPGVPDLAHHVEKETPFDKLPESERITALVIVRQYEQGARIIEEEAARQVATAQAASPATTEGNGAGSEEDGEARATSEVAAAHGAPVITDAEVIAPGAPREGPA
jgi:hypothetical protein